LHSLGSYIVDILGNFRTNSQFRWQLIYRALSGTPEDGQIFSSKTFPLNQLNRCLSCVLLCGCVCLPLPLKN